MSKKDKKKILDWALEYHSRGCSIIPIRAGTKKAAVKWRRYQKERPNIEQLKKRFCNSKYKSLAVILGPVSNDLVCRDFDTMAEYKQWAKDYPDLAEKLPTVKTSRGMHVYFQTKIEGRIDIEDEQGNHLGELRGSKHYNILPPSLHPDGIEYQWVNPLENGNLLAVDPELAGFISNNTNVTEHTEHTEHIEQTEHTEATVSKENGFIKKVIVRTLPKKFGQRNNKIFFFSKALRTRYPDANPKIFREDVRSWYDLALPNIRTKDFAETWLDFLVAWDNVKYFEGVNPMIIYEQAIKLKPPKAVALNYPENHKLQNLAVLCREIQKACGDKPFFLSARTAAGLLEISAMQANRYLRLLVKEDVLTITQKGGTAETVRKATRYRYIAN
ncbi:bifunctional DNA primase/polymerase [Planctomycetota bacterium]